MLSSWTDLLDLLLGLVLAFALGFERELRGAGAGIRVFSLIGIGAALAAMLAHHGAPNALAGVITGIGFIGGGLVVSQDRGKAHMIHGITTASAIFTTAAIGATAGQGRPLPAVAGTVLAIFVLELRYIRPLGFLDPLRWADRFDNDPPAVLDHAEQSGQTRTPGFGAFGGDM
ncbi:MgtC/SapB family protein [Actinomadura rupiterrae]|uniref:MgtC/SapB family protein n=1 Tax=Actinomadura rupiterrae TaxID=559627 RepID=UPI0020A60344|nr:MgtC/SapB family protein [Actinomadura rupiterrae]MCP2342172.1 putative Mg2+ transporter-C (MgtC) family protein [Actinomadura rupiterrae]